MTAKADTRIQLTRPPRPGVIRPVDDHTARVFSDYVRRSQVLLDLRKKAHLASVRRVMDAADALERETRVINTSDAPVIARLARAVAREADRVVAEQRLRAVEQTWVEAGVAEWLWLKTDDDRLEGSR